jgi:hypothetical protein
MRSEGSWDNRQLHELALVPAPASAPQQRLLLPFVAR